MVIGMTADSTPAQTDLRSLCAQLLPRLAVDRVSSAARVQELDDAIRDADAWEHRRAAKLDRDRRCYRIGAALEPQGGLDLDDLFLSGIDQLGAHAILLLAAVALKSPADAYLSDLLRRLSRTPAGRIIRDWGVWARWHWLADLYRDEVIAFERSLKGRDPKASWRRRRPTPRQDYLVTELARYLQLARPEFATSGEAHDWLYKLGGNPRFQQAPELPPLPSVRDLVS